MKKPMRFKHTTLPAPDNRSRRPPLPHVPQLRGHPPGPPADWPRFSPGRGPAAVLSAAGLFWSPSVTQRP